MTDWIRGYIAAQHRALDSVPADAVAMALTRVREVWNAGKTIFVIGNGGSAANASHFATDLGKGASDKVGKRFRVMTLADNISWLTALGNDYAYEDTLVRPLENFATAGDLLIALSVSGNSPNVVKAADWAKSNGLHTLALIGGQRGLLADIADQVIVVADMHFGRVEDVHMHILHMICYAFIEGAMESPSGVS